MFSQLNKHHIGIIIDPKEIPSLEKKYSKIFNVDKTQGTRVMFVKDAELGIFKEFIVQEGRAKNIPTGFYHVCYSVENKNELEKLELFIKEKKLGYPVTQLEKSIICYDNQFYKLGNTAIKIYDILAHDVFTSRITGSAITDAALIATGRINGRIWNKTQPYDIAPGIPIVKGAGGYVSDFQGNEISVMNKSVLMSSDNNLHRRLTQEIRKVI